MVSERNWHVAPSYQPEKLLNFFKVLMLREGIDGLYFAGVSRDAFWVSLMSQKYNFLVLHLVPREPCQKRVSPQPQIAIGLVLSGNWAGFVYENLTTLIMHKSLDIRLSITEGSCHPPVCQMFERLISVDKS